MIAAALLFAGCEADAVDVLVGSLEVTVSFSADALDDDGFVLIVDGEDSFSIDADAALILSLEEGVYTLELTEIDSRCLVDGNNPLDVTVEADLTVTADFSLTCTP